MSNGPLTGRQQLVAFGLCLIVAGGLLVPLVHGEIKGMVRPGDWMLIPLFAVGVVLAVPLVLFFQSTLGLFVGAILAVFGKLMSPHLPPRLVAHPVSGWLVRGLKVLVFVAAIGVLVSLCVLASKDAGGKAGAAARGWAQRVAGHDARP